MSRSRLLLALVVAYITLEVSPAPANVTSGVNPNEEPTHESGAKLESNKKSLLFDENNTNFDSHDILEKIRTINNGLPKREKQIIKSDELQSGAEYVIDEATLHKIQEIIAAIKPNHISQDSSTYQNTNSISYDDGISQRYSKALKLNSNAMLPAMAIPYMSSLPVLVVPQANDLYASNNALNSIQSDIYQTRQDSPSFPFQFQWPLASLFPILVKDPLLGFLHGGGWNNFFEIGQSADVCSRRQKSRPTLKLENFMSPARSEINQSMDESLDEINLKRHSRVARSVKNQNIPTTSPAETEKMFKKVILKPIVTRKSTKKPQIDKEVLDSKGGENEGDFRFPFSDFTWFGNKKPVAPSPGFFINKMRVRKGGVAIAGPGGVATAGRGGTAIVGPGGLAYTQPGGIAVAGPAARVIALSPYTDLTSFVTRLHQQSTDGSIPRSFNLPPEGRLVATGPVIYYHPHEQTASTQYLPFYGGAKGQYLEVKKDTKGFVVSEKIVAEESISSENILKNNDDSLLYKVLATNLMGLRTVSGTVLKLLTLGRKTGTLGNNNKARFKTQLSTLAETASNTVKLLEEIGENVDVLFNTNVTLLRRYDDNYDDDDLSEEGVEIQAPENDQEPMLGDSRIAEAKPFGLAVIGESGLAAARPFGTAVATNGVALARPVGTAIAGIDPTLLGIDFQIDSYFRQSAAHRKNKKQ